MSSHQVTVAAPINIAFIKYWGKREGGETLILPTNDSFSITLATEPFRSKTSVVLSDKVKEDELWLNGEKSEMSENPRLINVLQTVRATCPADRAGLKALIVSENNFPTAAGMASSASGFCALAFALVKVFQSTADVSVLSRIGSGSACRSAYGGLVKWMMGSQPDGSDCLAKQYVDADHWPELQVLCAVVKGQKKDISSTKGMQLSLQTSPLMADRIKTVVPQRMELVSEAVTKKDFAAFAEITMADSDDLQAVCRTTTPVVAYATEDSHNMIKLIKAYNAAKGKATLAYTFDAGPNCFMFCLKQDLPEIVAMLQLYYPTPKEQCCFNDTTLFDAQAAAVVPDNCKMALLPADHEKKAFTYLLHSPVGQGPCVLPEAESLIDVESLKRKE